MHSWAGICIGDPRCSGHTVAVLFPNDAARHGKNGIFVEYRHTPCRMCCLPVYGAVHHGYVYTGFESQNQRSARESRLLCAQVGGILESLNLLTILRMRRVLTKAFLRFSQSDFQAHCSRRHHAAKYNVLSRFNRPDFSCSQWHFQPPDISCACTAKAGRGQGWESEEAHPVCPSLVPATHSVMLLAATSHTISCCPTHALHPMCTCSQWPTG